MVSKGTLAGFFSVASLLTPIAALADHDWDGPAQQGSTSVEFHVHSQSCGHAAPPAGVPQQGGRYELRTINRWAPGYYEQVWVPQVCRHHPRKHKFKCHGGYYDQRFVPGRYVQEEQWVWVPVTYVPPPPRPAHLTTGVSFRVTGAF